LRVRRVLNVESGLNDGIVTPIVAFTLAVAATQLDSAGLAIGAPYVVLAEQDSNESLSSRAQEHLQSE